MSTRRRGLVLLLIAASCATVPRQQAPLPLWGELKPGRYAVGFRSNVWYPAGIGGQRLRYRDYAGTLDQFEASLHEQHVPDQAIVDLFDAPVYARADAPALTEKFPDVFIVLRTGQAAPDLAVVAEFLASHGYVVHVVDSTAKPNANAEWLHDVHVAALTAKPELQSLALTLLQYLDSHRRP